MVSHYDSCASWSRVERWERSGISMMCDPWLGVREFKVGLPTLASCLEYNRQHTCDRDTVC